MGEVKEFLRQVEDISPEAVISSKVGVGVVILQTVSATITASLSEIEAEHGDAGMKRLAVKRVGAAFILADAKNEHVKGKTNG